MDSRSFYPQLKKETFLLSFLNKIIRMKIPLTKRERKKPYINIISFIFLLLMICILIHRRRIAKRTSK